MIAKMSKYDFILYAKGYEEFIEKIRSLGLVDITTTGWESSESDRDLILEIEGHKKAKDTLRSFMESEAYKPTTPYASGREAYEAYVELQLEQNRSRSEIARLEKVVEEMQPWGEFSLEDVAALEKGGVKLHYFICSSSQFEENYEQWSSEHTVEVINDQAGITYFVVISHVGGADIMIDAQEMKRPAMTASEAQSKIDGEQKMIESLNEGLSKCASSLDAIESSSDQLIEKLQNAKVRQTAQDAADGTLLVMEAWAEEETSAKVDALLEEYPSVIYLKSNPTPEDNTPVKLKNRWFANIFELIGNMYALPKYGTIDLTPFFAPFYMLFFAICLCDAGYGLMITAVGAALYFKGGESMRQAAWLSLVCGVAAVVFGFFTNSFFGMTISSLPMFANFKFINFQADFFNLSMIIGVVQILFGMAINIVVTTRTFGIKYALGSLGWFLLLVSCIAAFALPMYGFEQFGFNSIPFMVCGGIAAVLMLFFNSPEKNLFSNFAGGLWDTYNNVTGLLGDVLSYIRLFAIGLSGGVLALVFNSLATGMTGLDAGLEGLPWWSIAIKIVCAAIILLIGHGINLFMSAISSVVHPMRLTFVEFFKNSGFEMTTREFEPLKKEIK